MPASAIAALYAAHQRQQPSAAALISR